MSGTMSETGAETSAEKVIREHHEIKDLLGEMRTFLEDSRPQLGARGHHTWAASLSKQLVQLHDKMHLHFRYEESSGLLDELKLQHPNASSRIEVLENEHEDILREIRRLTAASLKYAENKPPKDVRLRKRLTSVLDRLDGHERAETELIQRLVYREVGVID